MFRPTNEESSAQTNHPSAEWNWIGDAWDRRVLPRLELSYSLRLSRPGGAQEIETKTVNVSSGGFYFSSAAWFRPQETVACEMVMPWRAWDGSPRIELVLRGFARVVRVEFGRVGPEFGVACRLEDDYTILRRNRNSSPLIYGTPAWG